MKKKSLLVGLVLSAAFTTGCSSVGLPMGEIDWTDAGRNGVAKSTYGGVDGSPEDVALSLNKLVARYCPNGHREIDLRAVETTLPTFGGWVYLQFECLDAPATN